MEPVAIKKHTNFVRLYNNLPLVICLAMYYPYFPKTGILIGNVLYVKPYTKQLEGPLPVLASLAWVC